MVFPLVGFGDASLDCTLIRLRGNNIIKKREFVYI
jgi:hypothetical protein